MTFTVTKYTANGNYGVTIHDTEFTHALFGNNGIICAIEDVFKVMDAMHKRPTKLLRKGWHAQTVQKQPQYSMPWVAIEGGHPWVSQRSNTKDGQYINLKIGVGSVSPKIVVSREFI